MCAKCILCFVLDLGDAFLKSSIVICYNMNKLTASELWCLSGG